jgi:hypothetical protein
LRQLRSGAAAAADLWAVEAPRSARETILIVEYETGLRPKSVGAIRFPDHFRPGSMTLTIDRTFDKADWGRKVPLSTRAIEALTRSMPRESGVIFGRHDLRDIIKKTAAAVGLPPQFSEYDSRHNRATHLLDAGAPLTGVAYLLGHKQISTTNRYVRSRESEAVKALAAVGALRVLEGGAKTDSAKAGEAKQSDVSPSSPSTTGATDAPQAATPIDGDDAEKIPGAPPNKGHSEASSGTPWHDETLENKPFRPRKSGSGGVTPVRVQVPSFAPRLR